MHFAISFVFLLLSIYLSYIAQSYTNIYNLGNVVPDILLDNLPTYNVSFIFFQGAAIFICILVAILLLKPKYIPFVVVSTALFFVIRSLFMILTHLSSPGSATYQYVDYEDQVRQVVFTLSSGNDLFFSGHAGYPFLIALIFWKEWPYKYLFLLISATGAVAVILGHLHYSIDVFSAFFIAYGIYEMAKIFFRKSYNLIQN